MKLLVTGATGYIGGRLVPRLLEKGHAVRCLARRPETLAGRWASAEIVCGDVLSTDSAALARALPKNPFRLIGSGSLSFEMIRNLTERLPVMICPRWVMSRCQPIAIRDVLSYLLESLEEPKSEGRIFEIGGADGRAWLQFEVTPAPGKTASILTQTAFFEPKGLSGLLYWYVLYPLHRIIFSGLSLEIKRRSEE